MITMYENKLTQKEIAKRETKKELLYGKAVRKSGYSKHTEYLLKAYRNCLSGINFIYKDKSMGRRGIWLKAEEDAPLRRLRDVYVRYEKMRNYFSFENKRLLKRKTIERTLKRLFWEKDNIPISKENVKYFPDRLYEELMLSGIIRQRISKKKEEMIKDLFKKLKLIFDSYGEKKNVILDTEMRIFLWEAVSYETLSVIEPSMDVIFSRYVFRWINKCYKFSDKEISENELEIQIFLSILFFYADFDYGSIKYYLLKIIFPEWEKINENNISELSERFQEILPGMKKIINYKKRNVIHEACKEKLMSFQILYSLLKMKAGDFDFLKKEEEIIGNIKKVYRDRYEACKKNTQINFLKVVLFLFISRIALAVFIQVPFKVYEYGDIKYFPYFFDLIFLIIVSAFAGMILKVHDGTSVLITENDIRNILQGRKIFIRKSILLNGRGQRIYSLLGTVLFFIFLYVIMATSNILRRLNYDGENILVFQTYIIVMVYLFLSIYRRSMYLTLFKSFDGLSEINGRIIKKVFMAATSIFMQVFDKFNIISALADTVVETPLKCLMKKRMLRL